MEIAHSDARIDFDRMTVSQGPDVRRLTRQTAGILSALVDADGQVVSKDDLITDALGPIHPGWYHYAHAWRFALGDFWHAALLEIEKVPMPGFPWYHAQQVRFQAELGNLVAAEEAKAALLAVFPDFEADIPREMVCNYFSGPLVQKAFDGWHKAGLRVSLPDEMAEMPRPERRKPGPEGSV